MPLYSRRGLVNGDYQFRQPEINWAGRDQLFDVMARKIQQARLNNPRAGLNPDLGACADDLETYTCERLHHHPAWCVPPKEGAMAAAVVQQREVKGCAACGSRRRGS